MIHGIINIYKEPGFTSFDVVAKLRGILKQKKIGHTGTLDPAAEGVLPVCLGNGTKLCDMLTDRTKVYEAVLLLGVTTDTLDTTGTVLRSAEVKCSREQAEDAILSFLGTYDQVPPMYSAIKVEGKRLYELAREGKEIERKSRPVTIHNIEIKSIDLPKVCFTVECSKGTYIRSLCQDIGEKLGCGGCMEHLIRLRSGRFAVENAYRLSDIERMRDEDCLGNAIMPIEEVLSEYPAFRVKNEYKKLIDNGNPLPADAFMGLEDNSKLLEKVRISQEKENRLPENACKKKQENGNGLPENGNSLSENACKSRETGNSLSEHNNISLENYNFKIRVYNTEGRFFAIYEWKEEKNCYMPDKIFSEDSQ